MKHLACILLFIGYFAVFFDVKAQNDDEPQLTRILFIFDGSNSMNGKWKRGKSKIEIARKIFSRLMDSLERVPNVELALRMYGHQSRVPPQDCNDTRLEVPFAPNNAHRIRTALHQMTPKGTTPIAHSLELCANDFPYCPDCRNIVILITDGIEACDGDPCAIALNLQRKGIILKPFVIGIGLDVEIIDALKCVGELYNATDEDNLFQVLEKVISQATVSTTAQVNLLDIYGNATETNVNMTFYDNFSGRVLHNYMHTMNRRGLPDTITLNPMIDYRIKVHTIPPVEIPKARIRAGIHNIITTDAPQGYLLIKDERGNKHRNYTVIVRESDEYRTLNVQTFDEKEKYIVGNYDLEVLTLPRIYLYGVNVKQSKTTVVDIPEPGIATVSMPAEGYASLYLKNKDDVRWILNINKITKTSLTLQPGKYMIVYRPEKAYKITHTKIRHFVIQSGHSVLVDF